jgi:hypothetical protein
VAHKSSAQIPALMTPITEGFRQIRQQATSQITPGLCTNGKQAKEEADNDKKQCVNIVTLAITIPFNITSPTFGLLLIWFPNSDVFIPLNATNSYEQPKQFHSYLSQNSLHYKYQPVNAGQGNNDLCLLRHT